MPALNNIAGPAVAIEVSPTDAKTDMTAADFQQSIAAALANAIAALQSPATAKQGGVQ
jgi:hypothetical protein